MKSALVLTLIAILNCQLSFCQVIEEAMSFENKNVFVRVYDLNGKKISKGKIISISENSLLLSRHKTSVTLPVSNIGSIKTKHSGGNNVLIGAATGATTLAVLGAASADPDATILWSYTAGEGAAAGAVVGGTAGAAIGGLTILFKNSKTYIINGEAENWKAFKESIIKDYN